MSITNYNNNILNDLIDFNFIDYKNNILNELMSFNLDPTKLYIMKILDLNKIPLHLWKQFYEYLSIDNMLHLNILFNNKQFKLCFKFNIMNNSSKCLTCEPKIYETCHDCKKYHFDDICELGYDKCKLCINCSNYYSHSICDYCDIPLCAKYHKSCENCNECCSKYESHIYCKICNLCYIDNFHSYCPKCDNCQNSPHHGYCDYCNQCCDKQTHKYCDQCETCYNTDTEHVCISYCIYCENNYLTNDIHHFCENCNKCSSSLHIFDRYNKKCINA
jgi:hypothetical protein